MFNGRSCADKWLQATVDGGVPSDYDGTQTYESELSILPRRAPKPVKVGLFWGGSTNLGQSVASSAGLSFSRCH